MPEHQRASPAHWPPALSHPMHLVSFWPAIELFQQAHPFLQGQVIARPGIKISQRKKPVIISCPVAYPPDLGQPGLHLDTCHLAQLGKVKLS